MTVFHMTGQKLLVTGARGMVGKNILEHPGLRQWSVLAPSHAELDLLDFNATFQYLKANHPDMIVNAVVFMPI